MTTCSSASYLVDTVSGPDPGKDGAARMAQKTGSGSVGQAAVPGGPLQWLAALIRPLGRRRPETLEMALSRMSETSPHLLVDIGVHIAPATGRGRAGAGGRPALVVTLVTEEMSRAGKAAPADAPILPVAAE
ncbi:MAG: hypothetical protein JJT81_08115 [Rubellimicrobium sp.]|nr:hypothetical protein [Rubellimicrobium sp.]